MEKSTQAPKVSLIMACYNCKPTLPKAIDSILAQTYDNWVMICCDDGSTDGTLEVLREYEQAYPEKFVIIQNDCNRKLPYSLNHCLEYVHTDLVARMDGDDWCMPTRLEKQVAYLLSHPQVHLVGTGVAVSDGVRQVASIIKLEQPTKYDAARANPFSHATIMTYRWVYEALGGYSLDPVALRVEDAELWFRFYAQGFVGHNLQEELYTILENEAAVRRRSFQSRVNGAIVRSRGCKLMGLRGWVCYRPYLAILRAFVPLGLYQKLHVWKLKWNRLG